MTNSLVIQQLPHLDPVNVSFSTGQLLYGVRREVEVALLVTVETRFFPIWIDDENVPDTHPLVVLELFKELAERVSRGQDLEDRHREIFCDIYRMIKEGETLSLY